MFTSKRGLFGSESGATTSWLAGITAAALLVGSVALPAMATGDDGTTPEDPAVVEQLDVTEPEAPAEEPAEEPAAEEPATEEAGAEEAPAEEAVLVPPVEDEVVDETPTVQAEEPAPPAEETPAEEPAPAAEEASASSTDGTTPDNNSPPSGSGKKTAKSDPATSLSLQAAPLALATESGFQYTLEGCRSDGSPLISLPNGDGDYICPDAAYTTGNLGKDWAELDLVPHRVTVAGNGTTSFVISADREDVGRPGYDIMSVPVVNEDLTIGTCSIEVDPTGGTGAILTPGQGGADKSIYRTVTVTTNGTCVFDYHQRLALGSHLYPGASLHSNLLNVDFGTGGIGSKELSIPVNEIEPQHLDKTMTATQGQDYDWTVSKSAKPASLDFSDTCSVEGNKQQVTITVNWSRTAVMPNGDIKITTRITATNPAARTIIASVSDVWYEGTTQAVEVATFGPDQKEVAARSTQTWEYTKTVSSTATKFNDVATATYKDKVYPEITIPGNTTATATADVALTGPTTDATATLSDAETISGSGYSYAVDSVTLNSTPAGSFAGGYTLGTVTTEPVTWSTTLTPAGTGAASGSVVFNKTVHVATGATASGTLADTATLKPSDSQAQTDSRSVALSAAKKVDLTVWKTTPMVFEGTDSATFTFELYKGTIEQGETPIATKSVTIDSNSPVSSDQHKVSATFTDLAPGVYTVRELDQFGWTPQVDQEVDLSAEGVVCTADVTFDNTLTELKGAPLQVTKDATPSYDRDYKWTIDKKVDKSSQNVPEGSKATFNYTVEVQRTTTDSNFDVDGTIKVYNPNAFAVPVNSLEDKIGSQVCTLLSPPSFPYSLAGESTLEVGYDCDEVTGASATSTGTNKATATWPTSVKVGYLTYTFDKTSATGEAEFDFAAATPTVTGYKTVTVSDPMGGAGWPKETADTDNLQTFTYSKSFSGTPGECTTYDNTATITETTQSDSESVEVCVGKDLVVTKDAAGAYGREYLWKIDKSVVGADSKDVAEGTPATFDYKVVVTQTGIEDSSATLGGTITVSNPNVWQAVTLDAVTDTTPGWTCTVDTKGGLTVPKATKVGDVVTAGTASFPYTCEPGNDAPYTGTNTAKATWNKATHSTPSGYDEGTAGFTLEQAESINGTVHVGDPLAPGGEYLGSVTATDPPAAPASRTFTYSLEWDGVPGTCKDYDNTATVYSTYDESEGLAGMIDDDTATVTVCVGQDLTVTKTAAGTYDREYLWTISKKANATEVSIADGDSYTFKYTVVAEQTGYTDSGWTLSGKITVTNPNDWQDITADVTDLIDNGGTCTVTDGTAVQVAAGKSVELTYNCTYASKPSGYSGTNTAKADWSDDEAAVSPKSTATGQAGFTLTQAKSTNKTVNVTDSYAGTLGSVTAKDAGPWASKEFTYDRTESGVAGECTEYDNTATIIETKQSASEDVILCVGLDLTVEKTASGGFDREYLWAIDKLVNGEESVSVLADDDTEAFDYSVTAYQTGFTDSGWTLAGTITVTNPNKWLDITADVTDAADIGGTCTVVDGEDMLVEAGKSVTVDYTCLFDTQPEGYSGTNTATATWDEEYPTPTTEATGQAEFTLEQRSATNQEVEIVDTLAGTLGSLTATDAPEFTSATYTYPLTFEAPTAGECLVNPNTASVMPVVGEVDQEVSFGLAALDLEVPAIQPLASDSASAELCTGTLDKSADPAEGTAVETGEVITYTIVVENPSGEAVTGQTLVDDVPAEVTVDETSIAPAGTYDANAGTITWKFDLAATTIDDQTEDLVPGSATFTYKATVTAGFGSDPLVNTATWVERKLTDSTEHPVKAIAAVTTSFCIIDAPYYSLSVDSQNLPNQTDTVTVRWYQADEQGNPILANGQPVPAYDPAIGPGAGDYVDTYSLTNGELDLPELLWKGAAVDAAGHATAWPGWEQPSEGVWVQVDSGGVRPGMYAVIEVNPSATTTAIYPPAAAPCANPPGVPQLDKTADPAEGTEVAIDDTIDYSVEVTNTGGSEFTGPMVDTLPDGFTADEASISDGGVLSADGTTITWTVTLAAGASKTFTYSGTVGPDAAAELLNVVVLTLADGSTIQDQTVHPVAPVEGIEEEEPEEEVVAGIADTGADNVVTLTAAALLAILAGGLMVTFGRRRRYEG